jgi:hypothetical protein
MIFVAGYIIIFEPNFWYSLVMLKSTFGEFTMILSLLEIIFPHLCMFFIINMSSMFHKGYMCVC